MESKNVIPEKVYNIGEISEALKMPPRIVCSKLRYWEAQKEIKQEQETFEIYESKMNYES
jgi:hypothetical protein